MPSGLYHIKLWEAIDGSRNIVYTYTDGEIDGSNMRKEKIIVRPNGALYVIVQTVILSVYLSLIVAIIYLLITGLEIKDIFRTLLFIGGGIIAVYLTVFEIIKIVRYKIIVSNKNIFLSANKEWLILRHKAITLSYEGLKSLQYCQGITAGNREEPFLIIMAVIFEYADGKETTINLNRFSQKQIKRIMQIIKDRCKEYYDTEIEIKPDLLPRKK